MPIWIVVGIRFSSLPPSVRRLVLAQAGPAAAPARATGRRSPAPRPHLERVCVCGFEMFRPDGAYPATCDGCGAPWPGNRP